MGTKSSKSIQKGVTTISTTTHFSPPALHSHVLHARDAHKVKEEVGRKLEEISAGRREAAKRAPTESAPDSVAIPLTTVSRWGNFDAYISIQFRSSSGLSDSLLVDSGNSVLIVPHGENLVGLDLPYLTTPSWVREWSHGVVPAISSIDISTTDGGICTASSMHVLATTREAVALPTLAQAAQHLGF